MNYIKRLEAENEALKAQVASARQEVADFRTHLGTAKFVGSDPVDGSRKDWMAVADIHTRLAQIDGQLG